MSLVLDLIENKGLDLKKTDYYAAILGESPSKGAKSPTLWNAAFDKLNISGFMHPMDVRPDKLVDVVGALKEDEKFIGGAVTMPYKVDILPFIDSLEPEAEAIGAVNCIYKKGKELIGTNTDGAGGLWSLKQKICGSLKSKKVLLLGTGGAGCAVVSYIASDLGKDGTLFIANRSSESRRKIANKLQGKCNVQEIDNWPVSPEGICDIDVIVNCTSIGFEFLRKDDKGTFSLKFYTPLGGIDDSIRVQEANDAQDQYFKKASKSIEKNIQQSNEFLSKMNKAVVFDIIYQPKTTTLLSLSSKLNLDILNGLSMNLEQAVIAFTKTTESVSLFKGEADEVRSIMSTVRQFKKLEST